MRYHEMLGDKVQRQFGIGEPAPVALGDRVHHDDCDALGHVNNTRYMVWFERLRITFMAHYGIGGLAVPGDPRVVIRSGHMHWMAEMFWREDYIATCRCTAMRRTSMTLQQTIWTQGKQCAQFDCILVMLSPDGIGRMAISDDIRARLQADGAVPEAI